MNEFISWERWRVSRLPGDKLPVGLGKASCGTLNKRWKEWETARRTAKPNGLRPVVVRFWQKMIDTLSQ